MRDKKGITLISLVTVIIIMLILAGVSINGILNADTVNLTKEVAFKTEAKEIKDAWDSKIIGMDATFLDYADLKDILSDLNADEDLLSKLEIQSGDLVYKDDMCTQEEKQWLESIGIFGGVSIIADIKTNVKVLDGTVTVKKEQGMDVVIVMDLSGSMRFGYKSGTDSLSSGEKRRGQVMVETLNSTIEKIISRNSQNRISIVSFSSVTKEEIPLDRYEYTNSKNKNIFTYNYNTKDKYISIQSNNSIKSATTGKKISGVTMNAYTGGWTYIQGAMYRAYEVLNNRTNKENLPAIMLFTDGAPWPQVYTGAFSSRILTDVSTNWSSDKGIVSDGLLRGVETFKTIAEAKYRIPNCRFYAINIAEYTNKVDRYYASMLLNPNDNTIATAKNISTREPAGAAEINNLTASGLRDFANQVSKIIKSNTNKDKNYYYTDGFSLGALSQDQLNKMFENFIYDIEQNLKKEYTVEESIGGLVGVYTINSDELTYTTKRGSDGKTEDGTTVEKKYYFLLAEDENVKISVTAAAYKPTSSGSTSSEMISGSEVTIEREISVQDIKNGVDPNLYYLDGTIKWNARGEYKDSSSIAREALESVKLTGSNIAQIKEINIELPVRTEKTEIIN